MADYLRLKKANCKNCYKCIRHCPVKSISFSSNQANIVADECILCGHCFVVCPQNAKEIRNDVAAAKALLASDAPVYASVAPSFVANFPGATIESIRDALLMLGFAGAEETAIGATIVKQRYDEMVYEREQSVILSSCCPTVNLLIQKYYPEALPCLAHVVSPMQAHCKLLKETHPQARTVFVGPCISKKAEAESYPGTVDCVLTFEELAEWLSEKGVTVASGIDTSSHGRARFFPTTGGILKSMAADDPAYEYIAVDGIENCKRALEDVVEGRLQNCFVELSACTGSCVGGPAMEKAHCTPVADTLYVNHYAKKTDFPVQMPQKESLYKDIPFLGVHRLNPGRADIEEILRKIGKTRPEHELNCGFCGYNTCREKAAAVLLGKADLSMCLPYLKERAESFSDAIISNTPNGIIVINESFEVQQINRAALEMMNIRQAEDILGEQVVRILDPQVFFEVLSQKRPVLERQTYLADYRRYVAQSVLYDSASHVLICILRDVTELELQRQQKEQMRKKTIETADQVMEKQMRAVQEIASLLGETTAHTKVALYQLKERLEDE